MNKRKNITLSIAQPCREDWGKMTINEQGRHCASCSKTVTDFTNYTDKELVDFFKNAKGSVCGRFESFQMNRSLPITESTSNSFIYKALFGSAIAASIVTAVNGQDLNQNSTISEASASENHPTLKIQKKHPTALRYIQGKVIDSKTNISVGSGVTISIKGTSISTTTDMYGAFAIPLPDSLLNKKVVLQADMYSYKKKTTTLNAGNYSDFQTIMLKPIPFKSHPSNCYVHGNTRFL